MLYQKNLSSLLVGGFLFAFTPFASAQVTCAQGTLISNGAMDGNIGTNVTAEGWVSTFTPDLNDHLNQVQTSTNYEWTDIPLESPDGGTWQNLFGPETISQEINCSIDQWYELKFQYAAQGIGFSGFSYSGPVGVVVSIDETTVFTAPNDETQFTWENISYIFQALTATFTLTFEPSEQQYVGIDGICIIPLSEPIGIQGDQDVMSQNISAYPNPANEAITLSGLSKEDALIQLVDANGKLILELYSSGAAQKTIPTSNFESGLYLLCVTLNEQRWIERVVIQ